VLTLLTVQNTMCVDRVECVDPQLVREQIRAVMEDLPPAAVKTGALGNAAIVDAVAEEAAQFHCPLVVDPVMISKHGLPLLAEQAKAAIIARLIPRAFLVTPNIPEATALTGITIHELGDMRQAAECLAGMGARAVLVKGGHLEGDALDLLFDGRTFRNFTAERIDTPHTHGTGCTYSAAIAAELARGADLETAVASAKAYITAAIRTSLGLGHGCGPVNHHARRIE
jgi:hydroxymethylpyrimidine/phosphomethylpyrimidine kinase